MGSLTAIFLESLSCVKEERAVRAPCVRRLPPKRARSSQRKTTECKTQKGDVVSKPQKTPTSVPP